MLGLILSDFPDLSSSISSILLGLGEILVLEAEVPSQLILKVGVWPSRSLLLKFGDRPPGSLLWKLGDAPLGSLLLKFGDWPPESLILKVGAGPTGSFSIFSTFSIPLLLALLEVEIELSVPGKNKRNI